MNKVIGITLGDPAGIGPEVIAKALAKPSIRKLARFQIIGDESIFRRYAHHRYPNCSFVPVVSSTQQIIAGRPGHHTAQASYLYLQKAVELLKEKKISSLVTAPVSKEGIASLGARFPGHTEYLAQAFSTRQVGMMFVTTNLKTVIVTRHIPLSRVHKAITKKAIVETIVLTHAAFKKHFKTTRPKLAVCGLNPHAGEKGKIGREEITQIIPAITAAKKKNILVEGPFPADTLFSHKHSRPYDAIIAMYHDQGLIPIKTLYFSELVNLTVGLPFIRTSPAHGTAFDIAGKDKADPSSMSSAIKLAVALSR